MAVPNQTIPNFDTDRNSFPNVSEYSNPSYINTRFMGLVEADPDSLEEINQLPWFDPLDPRILGLFDGIKGSKAHEFKGERITTLSQTYYNTTSLWWVILMFNGFTHPDEIPRGATVRIPDLGEALVKTFSDPSRIGQKVTI